MTLWCLCCILKGLLLWNCVKHWHILQSIMLCACLLGLVCFFIFLLKVSKLLAMSKIELKLTLSTKAALLCNITAWINSVCMFCCHLPGFFLLFLWVIKPCNNYWAKEIDHIHFFVEKHIIRLNLTESTLDHQNVHNTCVIVLMMTDNDGNIIVDEDGYDYYYLDSEGRSRMMFLKLLFKVKLVHHCMFI